MESTGYMVSSFRIIQRFNFYPRGRAKRSSQITFSLLFIVGVHRPWKTELLRHVSYERGARCGFFKRRTSRYYLTFFQWFLSEKWKIRFAYLNVMSLIVRHVIKIYLTCFDKIRGEIDNRMELYLFIFFFIWFW